MTKINAFSLGGLNEIGKNCFVVEVDEDIFIFDCGAKIFSEFDVGVNTLIPDFKYLIENKERIKGLFISKIDINSAYGLNFLIKKIPNLKIFMSIISKEILTFERLLSNQQIRDNVHAVNNQKIKFGKNFLHNFYTATNMPGSCGYTLETPAGHIVHIGSFLFENNINSKIFNTQFNNIIDNHKKKVLLLIANVSQIELNKFTVPNNAVNNWMKQCLIKVKNNLIICGDQYDWHKLYQVFNELQRYKERQVKISFFDNLFETKFLKTMKPFLNQKQWANIVPLEQVNRNSDAINVIFLTGNHKSLFLRMFNMANNKNPNLTLTNNDYVLIFGESVFNNELSMTKALNYLTKKKADVEFINNNKIVLNNAGAEDIKLLINLLNPLYFWPNNSYHKHLESAQELAYDTGMNKNNTFVCENGEIIYFENDKKINKYKLLKLESVFVDSTANINLTNEIVNERKILAEEGVCLITFLYETKSNQIKLTSEIIIKTFGVTDQEIKLLDLKKEITDHIKKTLINNDAKKFKKELFKRTLQKEINRIIRKKTNKFPLILTSLINI